MADILLVCLPYNEETIVTKTIAYYYHLMCICTLLSTYIRIIMFLLYALRISQVGSAF